MPVASGSAAGPPALALSVHMTRHFCRLVVDEHGQDLIEYALLTSLIGFSTIAAFDVMNLMFLDRPEIRDELVHIYFRPTGELERYEIAPYGYLIGHYSRYVLPGSVRIEATSTILWCE